MLLYTWMISEVVTLLIKLGKLKRHLVNCWSS